MSAGYPSNLPGNKTTLTLYALTETQSATGGRVQSYTAIQTLDGSLQPLRAMERDMYSKQTLTADYKFIVAQSCFINSTNEGKLKESSQLWYGSRKFNIIFVEYRSEAPTLFYTVILQEIK